MDRTVARTKNRKKTENSAKFKFEVWTVSCEQKIVVGAKKGVYYSASGLSENSELTMGRTLSVKVVLIVLIGAAHVSWIAAGDSFIECELIDLKTEQYEMWTCFT